MIEGTTHTPGWTTCWRRRLAWLAVLGMAAAGSYITRERWLPGVARWLDVGQSPQRVDFVLILPGDTDVRPRVAAHMIATGLANQVLVLIRADRLAVGGSLLPPEHEVLRDVLIRHDVPAEKVIYVPEPGTTAGGDVAALAAFLQPRTGVRVAVVTSWHQTRRARLAFRKLSQDGDPQIDVIAAPTYRFSPADWWRREEGMVQVGGEYLKLMSEVLSNPYVGVPISMLLLFLVLAWSLRTSARWLRKAGGRAMVPDADM